MKKAIMKYVNVWENMDVYKRVTVLSAIFALSVIIEDVYRMI